MLFENFRGTETLKDFQYLAPASVSQAVEHLAFDDPAALAGGTDILVQIREGLRQVDRIVDLKKIPELAELKYSAEAGLTLGASVSCSRIQESNDASLYPALIDAVSLLGSWQIQSRASVGGNLCNASPSADAIPPLIVHKAQCVIAGPERERQVSVESFCSGPGKNVLEKGELLVRMLLPSPSPRSGSAYLRFIPRNEMDIAVVGVASQVQLDPSGQVVESARIALAAVAPTPVLAEEAGQWLSGKPATEATYLEAGERAKSSASPIDDKRGTAEYRTHLVGVLTKRTLAQAAERARQSG